MSLASSAKPDKSLQRSDSFRTRQQYAREATNSYSSYAAVLTGQPGRSIPIHPPYTGYPPPQGYVYPLPYQSTYPYAMPSLPREPLSREATHPDFRGPPNATSRMDNLGFQPNPFAREFIPTGASGGGSGMSRPSIRTVKPPVTPPTISQPYSASSTPPNVQQQVKKTASFENNSPRPPTPILRSQSASSMRPTSQYSTPPSYPSTTPPSLPIPPPKLYSPLQQEWGPPITIGTVRYVVQGQFGNGTTSWVVHSVNYSFASSFIL